MNRSRHGQRLATLVLFAVAAALALVLCEAILRLVSRSDTAHAYLVWPPRLQRVFVPSPEVMPGVRGESRFVTNSIGMRGDEIRPEHTYRVLAMGGSATECLFLDQSEAWPFLVQEQLNARAGDAHVWVGNIGTSGTASQHHLTALQVLPTAELGIDTVVMLVGVNDLTRALARDSDIEPAPARRGDLVLETFMGGWAPRGSFPRNTFLWRRLATAKRALSGNKQDVRGEIYVEWRQNRAQASEIRDRLPDLGAPLRAYAATLSEIVDVARQKRLRLVLVTQPALWRAGLPPELQALLWFGGVGDFMRETGKPYYSVAALAAAMAAYNATLLEVGAAHGVECVDLAAALARDTSVFYDDVHFNENGARQVAALLVPSVAEGAASGAPAVGGGGAAADTARARSLRSANAWSPAARDTASTPSR